MINFNYAPTKLQGLWIIYPKSRIDNRGCFERLFCANEFKELGLEKTIVNVNRSFTKRKGTIRGLHFQYPPFQEVKIIICLTGSIYDVVVDIRAGSPTFLQWHGEVLSRNSGNIIFIPEGFAHGFQTLEDDVEFLYLNTNFYNKEFESGLNYKDPILNILWPLDIVEVSEKDQNHNLLTSDFRGIYI